MNANLTASIPFNLVYPQGGFMVSARASFYIRLMLCVLALCCWPAHAQDNTKLPPFEATNLITAEADRFCTKTRDPWHGFASSTKHPTTFALWGAYDIALTTDDGKTWHLAKFPRTGTNPDDPDNEIIKIASAAILPDGSLLVLFHHWQAALRTPAGDWLYFEAKPARPPDGKPEYAPSAIQTSNDQLFLIQYSEPDVLYYYISKDQGRSWSIVNLFPEAPTEPHLDNNFYSGARVYISQTNNIAAIQTLSYESCSGSRSTEAILAEWISAKSKRNYVFIDLEEDVAFDEQDKLALPCASTPQLGQKGEIYFFQACRSGYEEDRRLYTMQENGHDKKYKIARVQGEHWPETIYNHPRDVIRTNDLNTFAWTGQHLFTLTGDQASLAAETPTWGRRRRRAILHRQPRARLALEQF